MKSLHARIARCHGRQAFSLVELLVVITVLGVILFFAFPNIVQVKSDSERNLAKARAEALNLAAAAYFQAVGPAAALSNWTFAYNTNPAPLYNLLKPYIAFPADTFTNFMPSTDYSVIFHPTEPHRRKATLVGPASADIPY